MSVPSAYARLRHHLHHTFGALMLALTLTMIGGCMSESDEGKTAPLPRMSKAETEDWSRRVTEHMAKTLGLEIIPKSPGPAVESLACFGKGGETSTDDRFQLMYAAFAKLPPEQHTAAGEKIRDMLKKDGYDVTTFRAYKAPRQSMIVEAQHPKNHFSIDVQSSGSPGNPQMLAFGVNSPCLLPPGATQSPQ
ncbi:hypothetical protein [Streptomyces sp. H27-D2]|uniref:hypothetical protein n=1 Tax=Streptomyces sp. H27-D2 TaxID=3046304 RepID=UPI002DB589BD|nr:hypothetical protein [Streptomyces sp. H27-D2]MEC4017141.1 hypothetical protein [Streptomyces sp. H27-D2]